MATTLNKVTVGNDFVLKIKVGLVQYGNNTVSWDYMDLTTCRNIVFNISCTKHNIDINLPFTIDSEDHSVISAIVRAELLHANSIYNFTISGLDSNGYRWTYISPKQQSFLTTAVTEETSAAAYTELAFTAGMIMPLAAQGKDGHTPYIGQNNNWWINGVDTGISAISNIDVLDSYYTKEETDTKIQEAIENIDLPEGDINTVNYIKSNIYDRDGSGYYLDEYGNISSQIDNYTRHFIINTGVELTNDIEFEIITSADRMTLGIWYYWTNRLLNVGNVETDEADNRVLSLGYGDDNTMQVFNVDEDRHYRLIPPMNGGIDTVHVIKISMNEGSIDGNIQWTNDGSINWEDAISNKGLNDTTIKFLPNTGGYFVYGMKIWKNGVLIKDYVPIKTDNGDGFHDNVENTDIVSREIKFGSRDVNIYQKTAVDAKLSRITEEAHNYTNIRLDQQTPIDCTNVINRILSDDIPTRWDEVIDLWEVSHNADYHYHRRGRYYDCDIDTYLDKDETTQHNIATYRFWHPIQEKYYTITIEYDYNNERGNLISCTYEVSDYATKTYVDNAIANIPGGSTPDLSNYVTNSSLSTTLADYVTNSSLSTTLADYVTNSSLSTTLNDYVTATDLSTELSDYVTSSDLQNNILSDYVTGTSLSTTLADYATKTYVDTAIANIPSGGSYTVITQSEYDQLVADGLVESDQLYIIL